MLLLWIGSDGSRHRADQSDRPDVCYGALPSDPYPQE